MAFIVMGIELRFKQISIQYDLKVFPVTKYVIDKNIKVIFVSKVDKIPSAASCL